jgi:O-antigen/teichoic acid export membrane protein
MNIKPKSLKINFYWTFIGNLIYLTTQWGIVAILTKIRTPEEVGQFTLGMAIASPIFMFFNLQLRAVQATDAVGEYKFIDYGLVRLVTSLIGILTVFAILFFSQYDLTTQGVIIGVTIFKFIESFSDLAYGYFQNTEQMQKMAISMISRGILSLIIFGLILIYSKNLVLATLWWGGGNLIVFLALDLRQACLMGAFATNNCESYKVQILNAKNKFFSLITISAPLGLVMMLISLRTNIPRYAIESELGMRDLGIFAAMAYLLLIGRTLINSLGQAAAPKLAKLFAGGEKSAFNKLIFKLALFGLAIGIAGLLLTMIAGKWIITLLYSPIYAERIDTLFLLVLGAAISFVTIFMGFGVTSAREFNKQVQPVFIVALVTGLASYLLVPLYKLNGAAVAILLGEIVNFIFFLKLIRSVKVV